MSDNVAIVHAFIEDVWRQGKLDRIDELFAVDYVDHSFPPGAPNDRGALAGFIGMFRNAFPGMEYELHETLEAGDRVISRDTVHGVHGGPFMGVPATGRPVHVPAIHIMRLADGLIAEHWGQIDRLGLMQQIGAVPTPGGPPKG